MAEHRTLLSNRVVSGARELLTGDGRLGRPITLVGGLAVLSRLGTAAHRVTTDVDTVNRRATGERGRPEVLLAGGATAIDGAGAMVATPAGEVRIDVFEISEFELAHLLRLVRTTPAGADAASDDVVLVGELLLGALR